MKLNRVFSGRINVAANLASNAWAALASLIFAPINLHFIGIEAYGIIGVLATIQALIILFNFGIPISFNRELARLSVTKNSAQEMLDLKRTLELANWAYAGLTALVLIGLSPILARHWLQPKELTTETVTQALVIIGLITGIGLSTNFYLSGLMGLQRQVTTGVINICFVTLRSGGAVLVLSLWSPTIQALLAWHLVAALIQFIAVVAAMSRALPTGSRRGQFQKDIVRKIWRFAGGFTVLSFASLILMQTDKIMLSRMLNLDEFGYYMLAITIAGMAITAVVMAMGQVFFPRFSQLTVLGDARNLAEYYHRCCQVVSIWVLPVMTMLLLFSHDVVLLWTQNRQIADNMYLILTVVSVGYGFNALMILPYYIQLAHGSTRMLLYINIVAIVVLIPLIVISVLQFGALGGALGWLVLNAGYIIIAAPLLHRSMPKGELRKWYVTDLLVPGMVCALVAACGKLLMWSNELNIAKLIGICLTSACALILTALSTPAVRDQISERVRLYYAPSA